jgi:hypothetical protein
MCWSSEASLVMTGVGLAATVVTYRRGDLPAIWMTLGFFTFMEALQVWGYAVVDQCGAPSNQAVTVLSYLHIAVESFFINAICNGASSANRQEQGQSMGLRGLCGFNSDHVAAVTAAVGMGVVQPGQRIMRRALVYRVRRPAHRVGCSLQRIAAAC